MRFQGRTYEEIYRQFQWEIADDYNIGVDCADKIAKSEPERIALERWSASGGIESHTFGSLKTGSDRLAAGLRLAGARSGDRIAIILPQCIEAVLVHLAAYKNAMITVPLARLFAPDALEYRLRRAGARYVVTDRAGLGKLKPIRESLADVEDIFLVDDTDAGDEVKTLSDLSDAPTVAFTATPTTPDTPALIIFTSGTTGPPKGALHGHRVVPGHLPGVMSHHNFYPQPGDKIWTPADWAWAGGLLDVLLPSLSLGVSVVFGGMDRFDAHEAKRLMIEMNVANAFIPPTALRLMRTADIELEPERSRLRSIGTGGESLGAETHKWAKRALGVEINEFYGQTECNLVLGCFGAAGVMKSGSIGKPVPGHKVAVIDNQGRPCASGVAGEVAVQRPDPVMFLGYWDDEKATEAKFIGDWLLTGDQAFADEEGYFHFVGREDDIINVSGYRVGPGEIEDCLSTHPAVRLSVAVGKPDELKGEIVKAYIALSAEYPASDELREAIKAHVKKHLSANIFPKEIEFVEDIPLTTTGKVIRRRFREMARGEAGSHLE